MRRNQLPEGVQDFLPAECRAKRDLEETLRQEFIKNGYEEIETPSFEYYDVFSDGIGAYMQENMIKFFDLNGRILVLRPDVTVPIARMISNNFAEEGQFRFFYIQNAYGVEDYTIGQRSEFTQAGVELVGKGGSGADAESIALAVRSLLGAGLTGFKIDIGQVGFYKGLLQDGNIPGETAEELRELIDNKNSVELEYRLDQLGVDSALREKLLALPGLFGGREVLEKARALSGNAACAAALDNLEAVYQLLCEFGYEKYLSLDLGMLHKYHYYSGIVFRGMAHEMGFPLLSGGRYDGLNGEFGIDRPAVGFALGVKRVLIALERQGSLRVKRTKKTVVAAQAHWAKAAFLQAEALRQAGQVAVFEIDPAPEVLAGYAADENVDAVYYYSDQAQPERRK